MNVAVKNVYDSLKYFYFILKFLGLAPYTFDHKTKTLRINKSSVAVFVFSLFVAASSCVFVILIGDYDPDHKYGLLADIWQLQYILQHLFVLFTIIFNFSKIRSLDKLLKSIHSFDEKIESLKWSFKASDRVFNRVLAVFGFASIFMAIYSVLSMIFVVEVFSESIVGVVIIFKILNYSFVTFFFLAVSIQFIISVNAIKIRLTVLTKNIR